MARKRTFEGYDTIDLEEEIDLADEIHKKETKKTRNTIVRFITKIMMFVLILAIALSTFSIVSFCWKDTKTQKSITNELVKRDDIFYTEPDTISDELLAKMNTFIDSLPEEMQKPFERWEVAAVKEMPVKLFGGNIVSINEYDKSNLTAAGYTFSTPRLICLNNTLSDDVIYEAFVHEVGHMMSFELGSEHGTTEWETLYRSLKNNADMSEYALSDEAEFFATCFEEYHTDPEHLKKVSQSAYDYIHEIHNRTINDENIKETFLTGITNSINTLRVYYYHFLKK